MATSNPMVPTPTTPGMGYEESLYRGIALAQLRILKQQMQLGGLTIGFRQVTLDNGIIINCSVCYNNEVVSVDIPTSTTSFDTVKPKISGFTTPFDNYNYHKTIVYLNGDVVCYNIPFKVRYWHNRDFSKVLTWDTQYYNKYLENYFENSKIYSNSFGELSIPFGSILQGCSITEDNILYAILSINKKTYLYRYKFLNKWDELKDIGYHYGEWYFSEDGLTAVSSAYIIKINNEGIDVISNNYTIEEAGDSFLGVELAEVSGSIRKFIEPGIEISEKVKIYELTQRIGGDGYEDINVSKAPVYVVSDVAPGFKITGPYSNVWNGSAFVVELTGPRCQGECNTILWSTNKGTISSNGVLSGLSSPAHSGCVEITAKCSDSGLITTWKAGLASYSLSDADVLVNTGMIPQRTYDDMVYTYGDNGLISATRVIKGYYASLCRCDILRANWPDTGINLHSPKEVPADDPALPSPLYVNCTPCGEWNGSRDNCGNKSYCCELYEYCWYLVYHATQNILGC